MRDNVDTYRRYENSRKHRESDIIFAHYFAYFASISHRGINHFYELRGPRFANTLLFTNKAQTKPPPPSDPLPAPFSPHPPADFIQRGIIKLIVFRQCQKQYTIGYRVRFNRRNTTSIDASRDNFDTSSASRIPEISGDR